MGALLFVPIAGCMAVVFRKKFEDTAFIAVVIMTAVMLLSGLVTTLVPGFFVCLAAAVVCTVLCFCFFLRDRRGFAHWVLTPGFWGFIILAVFFVICELGGAVAGKADTYGHWALAVKSYRYFDDIVIGRPSTDPFSTYPPALTLWNYLATKLWPRYSEGMVLIGQELLLIAPGLPLFSCIGEEARGRERFGRFVVILMTVFLMPLIARSDAYTSLYSDAVMTMLVGYISVQAWRSFSRGELWDIASLGTGLFMLGLTKETGVAYAFMLALSFTIYMLICVIRRSGTGVRDNFLSLVTIIWCGFISAPAIWYGFVFFAPASAKAGSSEAARAAVEAISRSSEVTSGQGSDHVTRVFDAVKIIKNYDDWQLRAFRENYINGIFTTEQYGVSLFFRFSPVAFIVILLIIAAIQKKSSEARGGYDTMTEAANAVCYCLAAVSAVFDFILMPVLYLTLFSWTEALYLGSFGRYMTPLCIGSVWFIIFMLLWRYKEPDPVRSREAASCETGSEQISVNDEPEVIKEKKGGVASILPYAVLCLWLIHSGQLASLPSMLVVKPERTVFWGLEHSGVEPGPGDKFLFINDTDEDGDDTLKFRYTVAPADANRSVFKAQVKDGVDEVTGKNIVHEMTADEFSEKLKSGGYNYLYLNHVDEEFASRYGEFFAAGSEIGDGKLYGVSWVGETPVLNLLGE